MNWNPATPRNEPQKSLEMIGKIPGPFALWIDTRQDWVTKHGIIEYEVFVFPIPKPLI